MDVFDFQWMSASQFEFLPWSSLSHQDFKKLLTHEKRAVTVGGLESEARFQVKKSACFWCHGRYHE